MNFLGTIVSKTSTHAVVAAFAGVATTTGTVMAMSFGMAPAAQAQTAPTADIVNLMDESGSMAFEQSFIGPAMETLDAGLSGQGVTGNQYGLVGFGGPNFGMPRQFGIPNAGGDPFGTAAEFNTATSQLVTSGGFEDGYEAIQFAFNNYTYRGNAARNFILSTDEDRDVRSGSTLTQAIILSQFLSTNTLLNAIVDATFRDGSGQQALGIDSDGNAYIEDGAGGFTVSSGGEAVSGDGTTITDYVDLALQTGGAAWDLNQLRAGGLTADSFTSAFLEIKVQEITTQPPTEGSAEIPTPALLPGLIGMGAAALRKRGKSEEVAEA